VLRLPRSARWRFRRPSRSVRRHEWNEDLDNGFRPAGLIRMSSTTVNNVPYIQDYGTVYAPGTATHHLTLYRATSGALVFSTGTVHIPE